MSNPVAQCTHIKTNGEVCGCPAVSGTEFCHHHSAIKTALAKVQAKVQQGRGGFAPIPFVFPEDRASMQINFFLLLQAYNEGRIDQRMYNSMLALLRSMARNLGKTGSLTEVKEQEQKDSAQGSGRKVQKDQQEIENDPFADLRHLPKSEFNAAVRERGRKMYEEECAAEEQKRAAANGAC